MYAPLVALLCSCGLSRGLAFAPPCAAVPFQRTEAIRRNLFSKDDDVGPIVTTSSSPTKAAGKKVAREPGGGWGSWEKVVSQRVEQDSVLEKLPTQPGLKVRTIAKGDMLGVSRLCIETFRGPFKWFELPLQLFQEFQFFGSIQGRLGRVTRNEIKHSMVIVEDTSSSSSGSTGKVVGFLEIGMLPKPSSSEESALAGEALTAARAAAALAGAASGGRKAGGSEARLGTEAGTETVRGEGAGKATGRREEKGGDGGVGDGESSRSSTTAIRKEKRPDVAYLANVVVDRRQRRRGIGRTMVSSAIEIVKELWPAEDNLYVSVEQGNDVAIALYEGMGFEMAALEDEMMARSRRRPPRIYLSKPLKR